MADPDSREGDLARIDQRLEELAAERRALEKARLAINQASAGAALPKPGLTLQASAQDKIALFRSLFCGRTDVYPVRWENRASGKAGKRGHSPAMNGPKKPGRSVKSSGDYAASLVVS
jgi:hypothetical protein